MTAAAGTMRVAGDWNCGHDHGQIAIGCGHAIGTVADGSSMPVDLSRSDRPTVLTSCRQAASAAVADAMTVTAAKACGCGSWATFDRTSRCRGSHAWPAASHDSSGTGHG